MKVTIEINEKNVNDTLASCHSRYWADECDWDPQTNTGYVIERENGDGPKRIRHDLNAASVERAVQAMAGGIRTDVLGRILANDTDGPDGDILLQLMAFGALPYG